MFTNCPSCARQFRIRAKQLARAEGLVQCGFCGKQFNALVRLYDKPLIIDGELPARPPVEDTAEPEFYIPQRTATDRPEDTLPAAATGTLIKPAMELPEPRPDTPPPPAGTSPARGAGNRAEEKVLCSAGTHDAGVAQPRPAADPAGQSAAASSGEHPAADYPFPDELAEVGAPKAGIFSRIFWPAGVLVLVLSAAAQAAWFNRDSLLTYYPQFLPQARNICRHFKCTLVRHRDISAIKLLNRDVRLHPRYKNALLVNATMINTSTHTQRFPLVLFSLFDTNGKVIAYRRIPPGTYLDDSMDIEAGMTPNTPVHLVLEVANADTDAVSFEFDFR